MTRTRPLILAALAASALALVAVPAEAAPTRGGGPRHGGGYGGHGHHGGNGHGSYWGWGLAVGVPWTLGWYDPWYWGYPRNAYGPYDGSAPAYWCERDEDCWRERRANEEPAAPTTQLPPSAAIGPAAAPLPAGGAPTQRPMHLNYCEASRAWFPAVTTCTSGWRFTIPAYN
jgi:hypothetical protein